jgi:hypothetical protein
MMDGSVAPWANRTAGGVARLVHFEQHPQGDPMKPAKLSLLIATVAALPALALAQHSHGGGGGGGGHTEQPTEHEKHQRPAPAAPAPGLRPLGSARPIEVLVVYYGFSPAEIRADQGEEIELGLRRSAEALCVNGLTIPGRQEAVRLPLGETIPVTLKLDRAETLWLQCKDEKTKVAIVVAPRCSPPAGGGACSP